MGLGGSHGSTGALFVDRVTKGENVVSHDDVECIHEGLDGDARKLLFL